MKPQYIKDFEDLGFGMFVHFGLYSMVGKGEWHYWSGHDCDREYYFSTEFANKFNPKKDWATKLARQAKRAGMKYITLTTKHHEGYCLYDACGLTDWDCMHYGPKRDLVREFVDACNKEGIKPFFYHAILDWHRDDFNTNFKTYTDYIIDSVEVLCKNYGPIGGLWFDGYWAKPGADWQFDRLYQTIRKYQPNAMIINNTGMSDRGTIGHYEIDSITFERGTPSRVPCPDGKERAGEMCEVFGYHWGYTKRDYDRKPYSTILSTLITTRHCNCNLLLNVGPDGNGYVIPDDKIYLNHLGDWIKDNKKFIYKARNAEIEAEGAKLFYDGEYYYAVIENVPMSADPNVQLSEGTQQVRIPGHKIKNAVYLDNKEKVVLNKDKSSFAVKPFYYGESGYARVVRFKMK